MAKNYKKDFKPEKAVSVPLRINPQLRDASFAKAKDSNISFNLYVNNLIAQDVSNTVYEPTVETAAFASASSLTSALGELDISTNYLNSMNFINENYSDIIERLSGKEIDDNQ